MGIIDFFKEKLGVGGPDADKIKAGIAKLGLKVENFNVTIDDDIATVTGLAINRAEASKIVMAVGNHDGVAKVNNKMRVPLSSIKPAAAPEEEESSDEEGVVFDTVKSGDTLSAIAKRHYGNANLYPKIFEANKPMLSDPDKIYPGQVLRIPPKDA